MYLEASTSGTRGSRILRVRQCFPKHFLLFFHIFFLRVCPPATKNQQTDSAAPSGVLKRVRASRFPHPTLPTAPGNFSIVLPGGYARRVRPAPWRLRPPGSPLLEASPAGIPSPGGFARRDLSPWRLRPPYLSPWRLRPPDPNLPQLNLT